MGSTKEDIVNEWLAPFHGAFVRDIEELPLKNLGDSNGLDI